MAKPMAKLLVEAGTVASPIHDENGSPCGFHCTACGRVARFDVYVQAHWDLRLTHTCECGQKHMVEQGRAEALA